MYGKNYNFRGQAKRITSIENRLKALEDKNNSSEILRRISLLENSSLLQQFSNNPSLLLETDTDNINLLNKRIKINSASVSQDNNLVSIEIGEKGPPGPTGPPGKLGPSWKCGYGAPTIESISGDLYVDLFNGEIWNNTGTMWLRTTLVSMGAPGPTGEQGPPGLMGQPGLRGPAVFTGVGYPKKNDPENPIQGDTYINRKTGETWTYSDYSWYINHEKIVGATGPSAPIREYKTEDNIWEGEKPKTLEDAIERLASFMAQKYGTIP
jgi:hypothetical protein